MHGSVKKDANGEEDAQPIEVTVFDYFVKTKNIELSKIDADMPCINVGKPKNGRIIVDKLDDANDAGILSVAKQPDLEEWTAMAELCDNLQELVRIAMVGKYTGLSDSYLSVLKTPDIHKAAWDLLKGADGILVPGGFGDRGVQGKLLAARYARANRIPYLGICLGMQIAVIEYTRSILHLQDANST